MSARTRSCRLASALTLVLAALAALGIGCGDPEPSGPSVGSNSNWLRACTAVEQCDDAPACVCGACSETCSSDADCDGLPNARCAASDDPAAESACSAATMSTGLCLPRCEPGACASDQACVSGACVLAALPEVAFCDDARMRDGGDRAREERLLALVQQLRVDGGVSCGDAAASAPAPAFRLDPRLICEARVFTLDIAANGVSGLADSQGRTTSDRLASVSYDARLWGESFAIDASSPEAALEFMLMQTDSCMRLTDAQYRDVGVGNAGTSWVVTIAAP